MIITDKVLESAKIGFLPTIDLETVVEEANQRGEGFTALMAVNGTLEALKRHTEDTESVLRSFCVAYNAYSEAKLTNDHNSACVWGRILIEKMEQTGLYPFPVYEIKKSVNLHNELAKNEAQND